MFPFIALFCAMGKNQFINNKFIFLLLLLVQMYSSTVAVYSWHSLFEDGVSESTLAVNMIDENSTILAVSLYDWESANKLFFVNFDFKIISEIYLTHNFTTSHYSMMQQFYDSNNVLDDVAPFYISTVNQDLDLCIEKSNNLSKITQYLILKVGRQTQKTQYELIESETKRANFINKCGVKYIRTSKNGYDIYDFRNYSNKN
jgi:hypothetical protein